jgi:hypothetical protein
MLPQSTMPGLGLAQDPLPLQPEPPSIVDQVWSGSALKGSQLLVMLAIARFCNEEGQDASVSVTTLAAMTRLTPRQIIRIVHECELSNELVISRPTGRRAGVSNVYGINLSALAMRIALMPSTRRPPKTKPPRPIKPLKYKDRDVRRALMHRDGVLCRLCSGLLDPFSERVHVDHIVPQVAGGSHQLDNLQLTHKECNLWKSGKVPSGA